MRIDLHMHSTASDGAYSPSEVVQIAVAQEMDSIALTDHDTVNGILEAQEAAATLSGSMKHGVEVLAGVELSAEDEIADRHILGYLLNVDSILLQSSLAELRDGRENRAEKILQKLNTLGLHISIERVHALAKGGAVGRPHIARAMLEAGLVASLQDAFDKYLGDDRPAYVPHYRLSPDHAIEIIHQAGGVAVLAHPGRVPSYPAIIEALMPLGLDGLEVYYPDHTPDVVVDLNMIARQYGLVMTVGSDFHRREGDGSARIGSVKFPPTLNIVESLRERALRYSG